MRGKGLWLGAYSIYSIYRVYSAYSIYRYYSIYSHHQPLTTKLHIPVHSAKPRRGKSAFGFAFRFSALEKGKSEPKKARFSPASFRSDVCVRLRNIIYLCAITTEFSSIHQLTLIAMKKPLPDKPFSDLRKERDIAQLQQTIRSLRAELHIERSRRQLAEAQVEYLSRNVDDLKTDVAEWQQRYSELLDMSESMQRSLYIYEEHAGSEEEVRIDAAIAELMDMTDNSGQPLITMGPSGGASTASWSITTTTPPGTRSLSSAWQPAAWTRPACRSSSARSRPSQAPSSRSPSSTGQQSPTRCHKPSTNATTTWPMCYGPYW